jgi:hypothetical protein
LPVTRSNIPLGSVSRRASASCIVNSAGFEFPIRPTEPSKVSSAGLRLHQTFQTFIAFPATAVALFDPFEAAVPTVRFIDPVLIETGMHARLACGLARIF